MIVKIKYKKCVISPKNIVIYTIIESTFFERIKPKCDFNNFQSYIISMNPEALCFWVTKAIFAYFRLVKNRYCFASEFPPNKVVMHCAECNETVLIKIYKFVRYNFEKSEKNYIFTDDIYNEFITKYGYVSLNEFSQIFIRFSEEAYGAKKIRKRRNNKGNPISAIQGIALKK